jgi:hypothetical protein
MHAPCVTLYAACGDKRQCHSIEVMIQVAAIVPSAAGGWH